MKINRRDFLKLALVSPAGLALARRPQKSAAGDLPNFVVVVLDALAFRNMSLHGYPRLTTPHIQRFSEQASVYHSHYSAGTFTTSGTASLLTGVHPWSHRAISYITPVAPAYSRRSIFNLLGPEYARVAFSQNFLAELLLAGFGADLDLHLPPDSFGQASFLTADSAWPDLLPAYHALDLHMFDEKPRSLIFGTLSRLAQESERRSLQAQVAAGKLQTTVDGRLFFDVERVFEGLLSNLTRLASPYFAYFHLYPPHEPYCPTADYMNLFDHSWNPKPKPVHPLPQTTTSNRGLREARLRYDQYLAAADAAFGRFMDGLAAGGILDNTYVILTSDHGHMFERGVEGHTSPLVYESGVRIPLLISAPGQTTRRDYYERTNSVDLMPTILKIAGRAAPAWTEGQPLPGFGEAGPRPILVMDAKYSAPGSWLDTISIALYRAQHKLIYYKGYTNYAGHNQDPSYERGQFEFYDLENDPEEMTDLLVGGPAILAQMKNELFDLLREADRRSPDNDR